MRDGLASPRDQSPHIQWMRTCPRTRSLVPRLPSRVWSLESGGCRRDGYRLQATETVRGCEGANRDLGSLSRCLAQRPALLLFWGVWLPRRRGPRVKRERRHPMCITKNARQQATTQPRSHSRAPPLEGERGGGGLHHPPTPTAATLSDPSSPQRARAQIALFPGWRQPSSEACSISRPAVSGTDILGGR